MTNHTEINAKISARIIAELGTGKSLPEAIDAVLGEGAFMKLSGETYDALIFGETK